MRRYTIIPILLCGAVLALAGCGGSDAPSPVSLAQGIRQLKPNTCAVLRAEVRALGWDMTETYFERGYGVGKTPSAYDVFSALDRQCGGF